MRLRPSLLVLPVLAAVSGPAPGSSGVEDAPAAPVLIVDAFTGAQILYVLLLIVSIVSLIVRYRQAGAVERR